MVRLSRAIGGREAPNPSARSHGRREVAAGLNVASRRFGEVARGHLREDVDASTGGAKESASCEQELGKKHVRGVGRGDDVDGREPKDELAGRLLFVLRLESPRDQSIMGRRVGSAGEVRAQPQSLATPPFSHTRTHQLVDSRSER